MLCHRTSIQNYSKCAAKSNNTYTTEATHTAHVYAVSVLQSTLQKLAAIDAADDDPDQQIPWAEEGDDAVETVVG